MLSIENISVEFGGTTLLDQISFVLNKSERVALTGKNGAGKSTLLKIIAGMGQRVNSKRYHNWLSTATDETG